MSDLTTRLDRLERSVGKLIDVISQSTLVARPDAAPASTSLEASVTSQRATPKPAPLPAAARVSVPAKSAQPAPLDGPMQELTRTLHKPEVLQALTRVASLAPQLEYAALGAAALPELIEEALAVARDKTAETHEGAPLEMRLQALAQAGLRLSHPEFIRQWSEVLERALPVLDKLSAIDHKTLDQLFSLVELVTAPALRAPLAQLFENLPALTDTLLALPTDSNAVSLIKAASDALSDVVKQGTAPVSAFGAMRALTDPQVRRVFGLAVGVARALGGKLAQPVKQLASGE